jgi:hypothetical protein
MLELEIRHESLGTYCQSFAKITREGGPIRVAADERYAELLDKHLTVPSFADLPAVAEFIALRDRAAGMEADLDRIELEREAAELERRRLLASTTTGEKLSLGLSAAEEKERAANTRLQASRTGAISFRSSLARAEIAARDAIESRLRTALMARRKSSATWY